MQCPKWQRVWMFPQLRSSASYEHSREEYSRVKFALRKSPHLRDEKVAELEKWANVAKSVFFDAKSQTAAAMAAVWEQSLFGQDQRVSMPTQ